MVTSVQRCDDCGAEFGELDRLSTCASCHGLLSLHHPPPPVAGAALREVFDAAWRFDPGASGVWRYAPLVLPGAAHDVVTHPEGNTPLLQRARVSAWCGAGNLMLKHEGHNPTGSFKDRGMTVGITQARRVNATAVACASTGNTSASLASYAAHAGLPALVFVPAGKVSSGKLAQTLAYGARTLLVEGDFDDCLALARAACEELGVYLLNSVNPFRIDGQKTIIFELLQQLQWAAPDWIVFPAGNLGNAAAFGRALDDAFRWGLIDRVPRLAAIQASGAAPFADAYRRNFASLIPVRAETVATAIRIGNPASYARAVRAIRATDGVVAAVGDDEILEAKREVDEAGVGCEPASAASVAGVRKLRAAGIIESGDAVVAIITGHLLKDAAPDDRASSHEGRPARRNTPVLIQARVADVERILREPAH